VIYYLAGDLAISLGDGTTASSGLPLLLVVARCCATYHNIFEPLGNGGAASINHFR
jgi:hypothetical protein